MDTSSIFGLVIPYLTIKSLISLLHSHKYDPHHELIIRNHSFFRNYFIPEECSYYQFYNYIKYYYLLSRFHIIGSKKKEFIYWFYYGSELQEPPLFSDEYGSYYDNKLKRWIYYKEKHSYRNQIIENKRFDLYYNLIVEISQQFNFDMLTNDIEVSPQKISSSKYYRSQNLNHQKSLRKQIKQKQIKQKQFNRKQFNRKQSNRKR